MTYWRRFTSGGQRIGDFFFRRFAHVWAGVLSLIRNTKNAKSPEPHSPRLPRFVFPPSRSVPLNTPMAALLRLEHVNKTYRAAEGSEPVTVLRDVSLEVTPGESLSIIGPSGSGKSTLLNIIGTLDHADSGKIWLGDEELGTRNERELASIRNREIGFVFQ